MPRFKALLLVALSSVLLVIPFHSGQYYLLGFIAFIPYFFTIRRMTSGETFKYSFLFGFLFNLLMGYWLTQVTWLGFILLSAYLALYFAVFGVCVRSFLSPDQDYYRESLSRSVRSLFFIPAFWVLLEWIRSWMISGLPWTLLAYSQWKNTPFIQLADITGAYGVSYCVLFINVAIFQLLQAARKGTSPTNAMAGNAVSRGEKLGALGGALAGVLFLVLGYGFVALGLRQSFYDNPGDKAVLRISVLQGNIPQEQKWDKRIKDIIFEKYKNLTFMSALEKSDLIVWPETSFPGYLEDEPVMAAGLRAVVRQSKTDVLVGAPTLGNLEEGLKFFNSAVLFGPSGEEKARYNKLHLVPFGEYVPLEPLIGFIRQFVSIGHFTPGREHTLFTATSRNQKIPIKAQYAVLICFEDIFPGLVREFCRSGAHFLVNITNDAWFGKTTAPYQHAQASVFRAVENRVPVVRAANTGFSCFISAEGRILSSVEENGEAIFVTGHKSQDIILRKERSFYTRYGDIFVYLMFFIVFLALRYKSKEDAYSKF